MKSRARGFESHPLRRGLAALVLAIPLIGASAPAKQAGDSPTVTVAAWNIAWFGDGVDDEVLTGNRDGGRFVRREADLERLRRIVARLTELGTDAVALQEIENEAAARRLFPEADWDLFVSRRDTDRAWAQRTVLAVRRAAGWSVERHRDVVEWSPQGRDRHGVDLTLSRGEDRVRVLGIHFESGCAGRSLDSGVRDCGFLRMQFAVLKGWLYDRLEEGIPAIVAGDWNFFLSRAGEPLPDLPGSPVILPSTGSSPGCWRGRFPNFVDHIVAFPAPGGSAAPTRFEEVLFDAPLELRDRLSDHCALVGGFAFR